jgi:acyl-[acyl carrier protein]--UDP-N-acetylglucosamine O-acyltransferase
LFIYGIFLRSVIGTRSVVASDVEPYTIVCGNPAKPIRRRFDEETIDFLLHLKWWNWSIEKIRQNITILSNADIESLKAIEYQMGIYNLAFSSLVIANSDGDLKW